MKILVTGCCGFIGSHLTEKLLSEGHEVFGIDNINDYYDPNIKYKNLEILESYDSFTFKKEDIRDTRIIDEWEPDIVCHLASMAGVRYSIKNPKLYFDVNVNGFINILEQCVKNKVKKIVYASSSSVYGLNKKLPFSEEDKIESCNSPYACSKLSMEQIAKTYFQLYGMASIGLRFFTVYGPRGRPDMAIDKFLRGIHKQEKITKYGNGETSRDYTYVSDIIEGMYNSILRKEEDCQIYNLGNSNSITLNNFISECEKVVGKKAKIENLEYQLGDVPHTYADISKAKKDLNFNPKIKISEGLLRTFASII
jgi:UDP-glucuronate 4-epimerase